MHRERINIFPTAAFGHRILILKKERESLRRTQYGMQGRFLYSHYKEYK